MIFRYPIAISLSPNTQKEDVLAALKVLIQPWKWKEGDAINKAKDWFRKYFKVTDVFLFNSGRSALYAIFKTFGVGEGDEVLLQAFTCVAVPDPIIWAGATPVYVDIDESLNIDPRLLEQHINPKTKAIVVQHTFGIPAKIELIKQIAQKYNLILIEDCAHCLGASANGKKLGTFGDAAFFSFGRDKVISSVFGGMAIISSKFKIQNSKLKEFQRDLDCPSYFWILQQLLHPIAFAVILPLYNVDVGKLLLFLLQKLHLLSLPVYELEKKGEKPAIFPARYPNALTNLLLLQLKKLEKYNRDRRRCAKYYFDRLKAIPGIKLPVDREGAIYLRFNILTQKAEELLKKAKSQRILLGNWYREIIDPKGVNFDFVGYKVGDCPTAEEAAKLSVNLPTYQRLSLADLATIVELLKSV